MNPVLAIALTAILSASVSTTVVLLSEPQESDAARAAATTQVRDRAAVREAAQTNDILGDESYAKPDVRKALDAINKNLYGICLANVGQDAAGQYCAK